MGITKKSIVYKCPFCGKRGATAELCRDPFPDVGFSLKRGSNQ